MIFLKYSTNIVHYIKQKGGEKQKMEEKNSFAIISQEHPKKSKRSKRGMKIYREERILVTEGNKNTNVFDIAGTKVASAKIENGVLKVMPDEKKVSKVICNPEDIIDDDDQTSISVKTEKGVSLVSGTMVYRTKEIETFVSKLPEAIAYCHPN